MAREGGGGGHSLQGEALHAADPELVVRLLAGEGGHVHEEELGLRGGPGRRLAQGPAHMVVRVLPLVAWGETDRAEEQAVRTIHLTVMHSAALFSLSCDSLYVASNFL